MKKLGLILSCAVLLGGSAAYAGETGAAAGAATGAIAGGVVGGPVGAAVGAGVGGVAGGVSSGPDRERVIVRERQVDTTGSVACGSKTVRRENAAGESVTVHKEQCD